MLHFVSAQTGTHTHHHIGQRVGPVHAISEMRLNDSGSAIATHDDNVAWMQRHRPPSAIPSKDHFNGWVDFGIFVHDEDITIHHEGGIKGHQAVTVQSRYASDMVLEKNAV